MDYAKKIRKLLRMAELGEGNEAEVAAQLAQKLMREHAISMAELGEEAMLEEDPLEQLAFEVGRATWRTQLAWCVAKHCQVSALRHRIRTIRNPASRVLLSDGYRTRVWMHGYGHHSDLQVWHYLYDVALRQIEKAAKVYRDSLDPEWGLVWVDGVYLSTRKAMNRFRMGAVTGLSWKLQRQRCDANEEEPSTALAIQDRRTRASAYMNDLNPKLGTYRGKVATSSAGRRAGSRIALNKGLAAAAGRRQLGGK